MKKTGNYLMPQSWTLVGPNAYQRLFAQRPDLDRVERVYIEAPILGSNHFGRIAIKWKYPQLITSDHRLAHAD